MTPCPYCSPPNLTTAEHNPPCAVCRGYMKTSIIVMGLDAHGNRKKGYLVIKEDAFLKAVKDDYARKCLKEERVVLLTEDAWEALELPTLEV